MSSSEVSEARFFLLWKCWKKWSFGLVKLFAEVVVGLETFFEMHSNLE